jgi:hypothetical protein
LHRGVSALFGELEEASENRDEIEEAIQYETVDDKDGKRRAMMLRAVALPSRAGVIVPATGSTPLCSLLSFNRQSAYCGDPNANPYDLHCLSSASANLSGLS